MKDILVIGANSYIGKNFIQYLSNWPGDYNVESISVRDDKWKSMSFSKYDAIYHLAGLVHVKETKENEQLYYDIDRDLPIALAEKAASDGAGQFIFMSSMSVYGLEEGIVTPETKPTPKTNYGKAKLQAENEIAKLENDNFKVCILRPPMVYGKGCRGNFNGVVKFAKDLPAFPLVKNERSMIYIDNLCNFVKYVIDSNITGLYFPQNSEYMNTTQMAKWIAESMGKKLNISRMLGICVEILKPLSSKARKGFGSLVYKDTEIMNFRYCTVDVETSVKNSI